jgi:hypothetical protein
VVPRTTLAFLPIDPDLAYRQAEVEEYASDQPEADGPARARVTLGLYATSDELVATPSLEQFLSRSLGLQRIARGVAPGPR